MSESESSEDELENIQLNTAQKKSRILKAFEDSDDEDSTTISKKAQETDNVQLGIESNDKNGNEFSQNLKESQDLFSSQASKFTSKLVRC